MTNRKRITCNDAVLALKAIGRSVPAKEIATHLGTDSRAVATALRDAVTDGRVTISYRKNIGLYRFKRLTAKPIATTPDAGARVGSDG